MYVFKVLFFFNENLPGKPLGTSLHFVDGTQRKPVNTDYSTYTSRDIEWGLQQRQSAWVINPKTSCMQLKALNHVSYPIGLCGQGIVIFIWIFLI